MPGIRRVRDKDGFVHMTPNKRRISDSEVLRQLASLAIPPAYLRNTPSVCRKSYINPLVFEAWRCGALHRGIGATLHNTPRRAERLVPPFLRKQAGSTLQTRAGRAAKRRPVAASGSQAQETARSSDSCATQSYARIRRLPTASRAQQR